MCFFAGSRALSGFPCPETVFGAERVLAGLSGLRGGPRLPSVVSGEVRPRESLAVRFLASLCAVAGWASDHSPQSSRGLGAAVLAREQSVSEKKSSASERRPEGGFDGSPVRRTVLRKGASNKAALKKASLTESERAARAAPRRKRRDESLLDREPRLPGMEEEVNCVRGGVQPRTVPAGVEGRERTAKTPRLRALLFGTPREVLARISAGDPLGVRPFVADYLFRSHRLIDADRLHLRALAHCARQALHLRASDGLPEFLKARVFDAGRELLREDREAIRNGRTEVGNLEQLARPLGLNPERVRTACSRFNEADEADRAAGFALLIRGEDIDELATREGVTVTEIARRARRALEVALAALGERGETGARSTRRRAKGQANAAGTRSQRR